MPQAWTKYNAAERLKRDVLMVESFLVTHGTGARPNRSSAELQAAENYWRWCATDGLAELAASRGTSLDPFIRQWRMRAVAADVRSLNWGAELRLMMALMAVVIAVMSELTHAFVTTAMAATGFITIALSLRWRSSILIVGPNSPRQLPPFIAGKTPLGHRGQQLALRLADFHKA